MKSLVSDQAGPLVETSLSHAATIIEESYQRHVKIHTEAPSDYLELRPWLLENAPLLDKPIIYDLSDKEVGPVIDLAPSQIEKLFNHEMFESWLVDYEGIKPVIEELAGAEESSIVLTEAQQFDRTKEIKERNMKKLFPPEKRSLLKRRFEEMAYVLLKLNQKDYSNLSFSAARTLSQKESVLKTNPIIDFYLERSLDLYMKTFSPLYGLEFHSILTNTKHYN